MADHKGKNIISTETHYVEPDTPWMTQKNATDVCCESIDVPKCKKTVRPWNGFRQDEAAEKNNIHIGENGLDENGYPVEIIWVGEPKNGICGTIETTIDVDPENCCEDVEPLEWDYNNSVSEMNENSVGWVIFSGGKYPIVAEIRGQGFYLDRHLMHRRITIYSGYAIPVYTANDACGMARLTFNDGCSETASNIKSTAGEWYRTSDWFVQSSCPISGPMAEWTVETMPTPGGIYSGYQLVKDDIMVQQVHTLYGGSGGICDTDIIYNGNSCKGYCNDMMGVLCPPADPAAFEGCITDFCQVSAESNHASGIGKQCGGLCCATYPGWCGGSFGENPLYHSCDYSVFIIKITTFAWRCLEP